MPDDLYDAIGAHYTKARQCTDEAIADKLRRFRPDPAIERRAEQLDMMRAAGQSMTGLELEEQRIWTYRNNKANAAAFREHGLLPDGRTFQPADDNDDDGDDAA